MYWFNSGGTAEATMLSSQEDGSFVFVWNAFACNKMDLGKELHTMFEPVSTNVDFVAQEHDVLKFWESHDCFGKLKSLRQNGPHWSFIDGPITANNPMGVHHAWGRTYKDLFHRYKAMQGFKTRYQNGFDCQGLWVEVNVEKELGFRTKRDIESYGIEKFVTECKRRVLTYAAIQTEQSIRLGYWMDWDDPDVLRQLADGLKEEPSQAMTIAGTSGPITDRVDQLTGRLGTPEVGGSYYTFSNENNYTIWQMLKECHKRGWIYKGTDVMPWCGRCGTGLSQHEIVTEGYQELTHTSVFLRFPLKDRPGESLLVWTTTPWTLTSNVAAAVNPELAYVLIAQGDHKLWLAKGTLSSAVTGPYRVLEERPGSYLLGWGYQGPFDHLPLATEKGVPNAHRIIPWDGVDQSEGTGIVHIAPGCGAEDYLLGQEHHLPILAPLDEIGTFAPGFGPFSGKNVHEVADLVFAEVRQQDLLYQLTEYSHRYPVCWRCNEELVFRLVDEWYISMGKPLTKPLVEVSEEEKQQNLRYQMMEGVAQSTTWYPSFGLERELDWLRNMHDWMISKKRYWGLALPIYECGGCGEIAVMGSLEELQERAVEGWSEFEGHTPHRPWIDAVKIQCQSCGQTISRIPDVGNPWLDAGIVAMSTLQYRTNRQYWEQWFPADLISESFPGQFRNWFYSLIAMSTVLERRAPFRHVFSYGTLLAEDGSEMHKSKGNAIWFEEAADKMGVDVMRWMYCASRPEQNLLFGYQKADETRRQVLLPLWNVYSFFVTYANLDGWRVDPKRPTPPLSLLDQWILSRCQQVVGEVTTRLDKYDPMHTCRILQDFLDDLSNWYIRRSRRRFWRSELDGDKAAAYHTLYQVLVTFNQLCAPFMPFVTDVIYGNLVRSQQEGAVESVHLTDWPQADPALRDGQLEEEMSLVRRIVNNAHGARAAQQIKTRQPLSRILVSLPPGTNPLRPELEQLILDEVNVKSFSVVDSQEQLQHYQVLPNLPVLGPKYGKQLGEIRTALAQLDGNEVARQVTSGQMLRLLLANGTEVELSCEEILIQEEAPPGLAVASEGDLVVALDTEITPVLESEGLAREVIRRVQEMRRQSQFELSDRIRIQFTASERLRQAILDMADLIARETLAEELTCDVLDEQSEAQYKVGDHALTMDVARADS